MQHHDTEPVHQEQKKRRGILFWLGRLILTLIILTFTILALVHFPPIQRWGINKLSSTISRKLNTKVTLEGFTLHPVSDLTLRKIYIGSPDHPEDTLIYADKLYVDYRRIWDLLDSRITIIQVGIEQGYLHIHRLAGDSLTNLDNALLRMLPTRNTKKGDFVLDLQSVNALALKVRVDDENNGALVNMFINRADVELDTLDIVGRYMSVRDLDLDEPFIHIINRPPHPGYEAPEIGDPKLWSLDMVRWRMNDGKIWIDNQTIALPEYEGERSIDFAHMVLENTDLSMDSLVVRGWDFKAKNIDIRLKHQNGFEIQQLSAVSASIAHDGTHVDRLVFRTPDSEINNSITLSYSGYTDFQTFVDSVRIDIPEADIKLRVDDLMSVMPGLWKVDFFRNNAGHDITLQGRIIGNINRLRIQNMVAGLGGIQMSGDFRSRDLAVKGAQFLSLDLEHSSASADNLRSIFPALEIPSNMNKLGTIQFTGKFDGYPDDFVAYGQFRTALGGAIMDMKLNLVNGVTNARYSGSIAFQDFDLGTFLEQKDFGRVTLSGRVIEGRGLTAEALFAEVTGQMTSLVYRGYTYRNARIDGHIADRRFNGTLDINDPNLDMHFEGNVDFRDSLPKLDFISRLDHIHFKELGFSEQPVSLSGIFNVDMSVGKIEQISGALHAEQVVLHVEDTEYRLDSLQLIADVDTLTGDRFYLVRSDLISGTISGVFDPATIPNQVHHYLYEHYPRSLKAPSRPFPLTGTQRVSWNLKIHDSQQWFDLTGVKDFRLKNVTTQGMINLNEQKASGTIDLPEVHYGNISAYVTTITFTEGKGHTDFDLELIAADVGEDFFFEEVFITGSATDDSIRINFKTDHLADLIDKLDLDIHADPSGDAWNLTFNPRRLVMLGDDWQVPQGNRVEIKKGEFTLDNFELVSGDQKIIIDDIDHKGLEAYVSGFDISYLNELWINDKFKFTGLYTLDVEVDNIYNIRQMKTKLHLPALKINNVPYGEWVLHAVMEDPKDSVRIDLQMKNEEASLTARGAYLPPIKSIPKDQQNYLRLGIIANEFPLDFLEFLLGGNIRDTEGSVDMTMDLKGKTNRLNPNGKGKVYNGSTTIDYLGAAYSFHDQAFTITETMIDLSGAKLYDVLGNSAVVEGGLTHRYLRDLGLNATISSDKILGLDVTSEENNVFYGRGIGSVFARFSGTVANPTMQIQTTTAKGTHIYIPLSGSADGTDRDFAIFLENGRLPATNPTQISLGGINLTMNMTITEDAIIEIIFDDNTGEVLRGIGRGNLQLSMSRTGNFSMYGNYYIEEGDYLFTNWRVVRKSFELLRGGRIQWDGDPYDATLDVQAKYRGLTAPVYPLIQEYLVNAPTSVIDQAKQRWDVDLTMSLSGSLLHPDIKFDIAFPNMTGDIKGYTDTKVNALRANEVAMVEQVWGLLFTRSFLPSTSGVNPGVLSKGVDNTLSELFAASISSYLSGVLGDIIPQGNFLSGIDFQVGLDLPITRGGTTLLDEEGQFEDPAATEVEINLPLEFFNDRLSVNVGGNYVSGASFVSNKDYFAGDVTFEYWITSDRRLKIRAYNRNTVTVEGRKNKIGAGLAYRREYDSLREFLGIKKNKK